ncbi:MAG: P-loop NTPase [Bacteroidales bacterium]|nr:P-loop NTPase [Bacteroidales bacterium]
MKIAISGKGGSGKSTLAATLALLLARESKKVLAIDADADANLATALGATQQQIDKIIPISKQVALIEERTGAKVKQYGQMFKLNPLVSDIADKYATNIHDVALLVLGAVERGGSGCACPENVLLRALVTDLILFKDNALILDMEAGVEHLGRATAKGVDTMIIVVEPGQRSVESSGRIIQMAKDIGIKNIRLVANKIYDDEDEKYIRDAFSDVEFIGIIPYSADIRKADRDGRNIPDINNKELEKHFSDILIKLKDI